MAQSYDGLISRTLWAAVLHPFDLIATRMITERSPAYRTASMAVSSVVDVSQTEIRCRIPSSPSL
jgi:hypothetical protein